MSEEPKALPTGTKVRHSNQEWARGEGIFTAEITEVKGPCGDGTFEYEVLAGRDFSRSISDDNPMDRLAWWSSRCTIPVEQQENPEQIKG